MRRNNIFALEALANAEKMYSGRILDELMKEGVGDAESGEMLGKAAIAIGKSEAYQDIADYLKGLPRLFSRHKKKQTTKHSFEGAEVEAERSVTSENGTI